MLVRNTLEEYGDNTIFEAESKEAAADEWNDCMRVWASERYEKLAPEDQPDDGEDYIAHEIDRMRAELIAGFEVVLHD